MDRLTEWWTRLNVCNFCTGDPTGGQLAFLCPTRFVSLLIDQDHILQDRPLETSDAISVNKPLPNIPGLAEGQCVIFVESDGPDSYRRRIIQPTLPGQVRVGCNQSPGTHQSPSSRLT